MGEKRVTSAWVNSCVKLQRKLLLNNSKYWWRLIYTSPGTHVESWWHMSGIWSWCCLSWSVIDLGTGETGARPTLSGVHNSADRRLADCSTAALQACHHANLLVSCVLNFCLSLDTGLCKVCAMELVHLKVYLFCHVSPAWLHSNNDNNQVCGIAGYIYNIYNAV